MNFLLLVAGILSSVSFGIHVFIGDPLIARPLLQSTDIRSVPKYTNYYCWHIVSIVLAAMAAAYFYAAYRPESVELAIGSTVLAASFALWNLVLIAWKRQSPLRMPQWVLFTGITLLGLWGLIGPMVPESG